MFFSYRRMFLIIRIMQKHKCKLGNKFASSFLFGLWLFLPITRTLSGITLSIQNPAFITRQTENTVGPDDEDFQRVNSLMSLIQENGHCGKSSHAKVLFEASSSNQMEPIG